MKPVRSVLLLIALTLHSSLVRAQQCVPPQGGVCLTQEQKEKIQQGLLELRDIHESPAKLELHDPVVVIQDWDGRVYVNGGQNKPLSARLTVGQHIDRYMAVSLPVQVFYRPKPPDPMFRLRVRAEAGLLLPQVVDFLKDGGAIPMDGGVGWDFFHLGDLNLAAHTGIRSSGLVVGYDLTRNFGLFTGPGLAYEGLKFTVATGVYFSFN